MLFSACHKNIFSGVGEVPDTPQMWNFGDQTCFNYLVNRDNTPFESLDYSFNRMDLGHADPNKERFKANFIHYAGPCRYNEDDLPTKFHQMERDSKEMYGEFKVQV